jgi:hypothetical protein
MVADFSCQRGPTKKGKEGITLCPFRTELCYRKSSPNPQLDLVFVFEAVSFFKLLYASCCINEFLLSGKERVTVGTDIDVDIAHCGAGFG